MAGSETKSLMQTAYGDSLNFTGLRFAARLQRDPKIEKEDQEDRALNLRSSQRQMADLPGGFRHGRGAAGTGASIGKQE